MSTGDAHAVVQPTRRIIIDSDTWRVREPNALVDFQVDPTRWKQVLYECLR